MKDKMKRNIRVGYRATAALLVSLAIGCSGGQEVDRRETYNNLGNFDVSALAPGSQLLEAEDGTLDGDLRRIKLRSGATGGSNLNAVRAKSDDEFGKIILDFQGESGFYDISVRYLEEPDGQTEIALKTPSLGQRSWVADEAVTKNQFVVRSFSNVSMKRGDQVTVLTKEHRGEKGIIDHVLLTPTNLTVETPPPSQPPQNTPDEDAMAFDPDLVAPNLACDYDKNVTDEPSLPFEERFDRNLKGRWISNSGQVTWDSPPIRLRSKQIVRVSFGVAQSGPNKLEESDYLKVTYRINNKEADTPLFLGRGEFEKALVTKYLCVDSDSISIHVEALTTSNNEKIIVDNIRVEAPGIGDVVPSFELPAYRDPPRPADPKNSGLVQYMPSPRFKQSANYALEVNGIPVLVEQLFDDPSMRLDRDAKDFKVSLARMAFDFGQANATIKVTTRQNFDDFTISPRNPRAFGISGEQDFYRNLERSPRDLTFTIDEPRKMLLQLGDLEYLMIFVDPIETNAPRVNQSNVLNLADYLDSNRDLNVDVTAAVQQAIDDAAMQRKILFVPDGLYMTGQLVFGTNSQVYLSSGAHFQAIPTWERSLYPAQAGANATNADSSYIFVGDPDVSMANRSQTVVRNVKIYGRGTIDGNGWNMRYYNDDATLTANVKLLRTANASNVQVEDVTFIDSPRWSFHVLLTNDSAFRNVKLVNNLQGFIRYNGSTPLWHTPYVTNTDGFDVDASQHVVIEDSFLFTADDAFTPKVTNYMGLTDKCHDLTFRNNITWSEKVAIKIGSETWDDIYNINYHDNHVIRSDRLLSILSEKAENVSINNVRLKNNRIEQIGGNNKERFFRLRMLRTGEVRDIFVDDTHSLSAQPKYSSAEGLDDNNRIFRFEIRNFFLNGNRQAMDDLFRRLGLTNNYADVTHSQVNVD